MKKLKTFDVDVYINRTVTMRVRAPSAQQATTAVDNGEGKEVDSRNTREEIGEVREVTSTRGCRHYQHSKGGR